MDEEKLFELLNTAEAQIINNQSKFFELWNTQISSCFCVDNSFKIEEHISVYGGFKLTLDEFSQLDNCWKLFFSAKGKEENEYIWLRGYSYYECDPQMHTKKEGITERILWQQFTKHWYDYNQLTLVAEQNTFDVINWIATISFLEYVFNDLTTLLWFVLTNDKEKSSKNNYSNLLSSIQTTTDEVAYLLSSLLKCDCIKSKNEIFSQINQIISNDTINKFLLSSDNLSLFKHGCMRAVREADSLPLIYSAYLLKLSPYCDYISKKKILFLSNAFGALNIGLLFKNLINDSFVAEHTNVHYSQHRADSAQIGESSGAVKFLSSNIMKNAADKKCVIVVDDCVFTGKSYSHIKKEFEKTNDVFLLPLSVDVQSLMYYNRYNRNIEETYHTSENVLLWAHELGNNLPAFEAFWDWKHFSEESIQDAKTDYERIMCGGDVLLKKLWMRYKEEIEQKNTVGD